MNTSTSTAAPARTTAAPSAVVSALTEHTTANALDLLFLAPFVAGDQPASHTRTLDQVRPDAPLLPPGGREVRRTTSTHAVSRLVTGDGWSLHTVRQSTGNTYLAATATTPELALDVIEQAVVDATDPPADDDAVDIGFWTLGRRGPHRLGKRIVAPAWADIAGNYSQAVSAALAVLGETVPAAVGGRLLLLHGPPGTGKTTALRALARRWSDWCSMEYVLDPEHLLGDAAYLNEVAGDGDDDEGRWRLLVLEDCDELIAADAKASAGQALARLLNLTDGILGQGLPVVVAITTNEPIHRLHPAVVRPGRCLAQIEVGPLTPSEAQHLLGPGAALPDGPMTLAELVARQQGGGPIEVVRPTRPLAGYL